MPKMQPDANSKPIPALRPVSTITLDGSSSAYAVDSVLRLCSSSNSLYGVGTATVLLPAYVVEYIRVDAGDVLATDSAVNVTVMG